MHAFPCTLVSVTCQFGARKEKSFAGKQLNNSYHVVLNMPIHSVYVFFQFVVFV